MSWVLAFVSPTWARRGFNVTMAVLPKGTVTLLFSDVDGSTVLLSRLGPAYADALDGQRRVLRSASATHGGTEMGTEGDGFFVAFPTAPAAVAAATEAQRELAVYPWPQGERVRVRMGIHTGSPAVHEGGYVGMDVHRAARIAGAAHGGQVVLSNATAHLVTGGLPLGVALHDLGTHRLKDLPSPERLFQLRLPGLQAEFAPLKSLGAASSLPAPPTPLVGRDEYLSEIADLVGSRSVRLVTLTGPGGAGKTRLALALAHQLIESFPDGVYFVPLAAVTSSGAMWTSIAEVLDVPVQSRTPPALYDHLEHRSALFVLDNLEQLVGADAVVAELLATAHQLVILVTSRSPLHVLGEHERAVQPLALPTDNGMAEVARSGAAQLFIQQAASVRSTFALTSANAGDVAAICRRLDGLPLAIELAAARTKMLSPQALLGRLDRALDISAAGSQGPSRQRTLRDTIDWSYNLLTPVLQGFFRRLAVFGGGADLDAIAALTHPDDRPREVDPLDLVASLVDASLVTVTESPDGEPRIGMLQMMRVYALDQLRAAGEDTVARRRHARHYLEVAEGLSVLLTSQLHLEVRARFEVEIDNFREALEWASGPGSADGRADDRADDGADGGDAAGQLGLRLCAALDGFWFARGYDPEERRWLERALDGARGQDSPELAQCLAQLARALHVAGDLDRSREYGMQSVVMWRRLGERTPSFAAALQVLATVEDERGRSDVAGPLLAESLEVAEAAGDRGRLALVLISYATFVGAAEDDYERSLAMETRASRVAQTLGDPALILLAEQNMACSMRLLGRVEEARQVMRRLIGEILELDLPIQICALCEDYAAILGEQGHHVAAVRLLGAASAQRVRIGAPRSPVQELELADAIMGSRAAMSDSDWGEAFRIGEETLIRDALAAHVDGG